MSSKSLKERQGEIIALVLLVQKGDTEAFSKLYDIFIDPVYRYVYYRVKNGDVEDIVETVFLKVWENIKKFKVEKKPFSAWIFKIAHNLVIDYYRVSSDETFRELDERMPDVTREHNPINKAEQNLDNQILKKALAKLKKPYRDVIIHKFINGFSNEEIGQILRKKEGGLRVLQFRALKALKRELENMGINYEI